MQTVGSTVTKSTEDHKDLQEATSQVSFMLKQDVTASNRQLQYERQTDPFNPYLRGTTCLWVLPVLVVWFMSEHHTSDGKSTGEL